MSDTSWTPTIKIYPKKDFAGVDFAINEQAAFNFHFSFICGGRTCVADRVTTKPTQRQKYISKHKRQGPRFGQTPQINYR